MVLQGKSDEKKTWSIPCGGVEKRETFEECCLRELKEETGYKGEIIRKIKVKNGRYEDIGVPFEVHYFLVRIIGGKIEKQDPDHLIYDIGWKIADELSKLTLSFPEDKAFPLKYIANVQSI